MSEYRNKNHAKVREIEKRYYEKRKVHLKQKYASDPIYRESILLINKENRYGLKHGEYNVLFEAQNGVCSVCKKVQDSKKTKRLFIDHNHITGKVRGLICNKCNVALGMVGDSVERLEMLISYLRNHS
jgi:hypothetical protein